MHIHCILTIYYFTRKSLQIVNLYLSMIYTKWFGLLEMTRSRKLYSKFTNFIHFIFQKLIPVIYYTLSCDNYIFWNIRNTYTSGKVKNQNEFFSSIDIIDTWLCRPHSTNSIRFKLCNTDLINIFGYLQFK